MDNYVGKIVKISGTDSWSHDFSVVGIVCGQRAGFKGDSTVFSLIKTDGSYCDSVAVMHNEKAKITATQIEPELRNALKEAYRAKIKLTAFEEKYNAEKKVLEEALSATYLKIKEHSNDMTSREFMDALGKLFTDKYPSSGGMWDRKYFEVNSISSKEVSMRQVQDVEKYATPEGYPFLHRRYDETLSIDSQSPEYKRFCERHAPNIIPELGKHCKTEVYAGLGDKNWLSVIRVYSFPIKYGYSKKSLQDIQERILGMKVSKPSLSSKIEAAEARSGSGGKDYVKSIAEPSR